MTNAMFKPCLVLNASYEPVNICAAKRAMVLVIKGAAVVEEERDVRIHRDHKAPSVVRLSRYHKIPRRMQVLSRKNIYTRDNYTCQYCGKRLSAQQLTLDHIIPRAQGGESRWENLVACCEPCNRQKGDKTPEQAEMTLRRRPRPSNIHTHRSMMRMLGEEEEKWKKYLYYN